MTGLDINEFDRLCGEFEYYHAETEAERLARSDRQRARGAGGRFKHDLRTRLMMALVWLRTYPTYEVLGVLFDLDKGNISRNLKSVLPALEKATGYDIEWPDKSRRKMQMTEAMKSFPEVFAIGDGMEQPVQRPKDNKKQKEYYSGKKKRHTVQNQVVVAPTGEIIALSDDEPGSCHDLTHLRISDILAKLEPDDAAMLDMGYLGVQNDRADVEFILPFRKPKGGELTLSQKEFNRLVARCRVVVENTICHLKRFQVLYQVYRHGLAEHSRIVRIIAGLVNRQIRRRPLRRLALNVC
jgi:hypothetical protein